jgi:hemoglobin
MSFFGIILPAILIVLIAIMVVKSGAEAVALAAQRKPSSPGKAKPKTMYETLGGAPAIDAAVDIFYRRVLADAYIRPFFEGIDMVKQAAKQKAFLTMVFGGPNKYTGKDMREGHRHLVKKMGLNDSHFDHVLAHLRSTLAELGVGEGLIQTVIDTAESTRNDVLDR